MNKNLPELIRSATDKGVGSILSTNFSVPFSAERAEALVAAGLTQLGVSLDGASQETYEGYRVQGDYEQVIANVRLVNAAKRKLRSKTPRVIWSFHVFEHNKDDVGRASALATELGMAFEVSKGWVIGPEWNPGSVYQLFAAPSVDGCEFLWQRAVIDNDGGVAPCNGAFFKEDDFGSAADRTFMSVWNNRRFQEARRLFKERDGPTVGPLLCHGCPELLTRWDYMDHRARGGKRDEFHGRFTSNDGYNYFFNRRLRRPGRAGQDAPEVIELAPVSR